MPRQRLASTAILTDRDKATTWPEARHEGGDAPCLRPQAGGGALWLARLGVTNFRCYAAATLEVDPRPVVLAGPNGAGKTNLLEAISFLAPGRGLRGARLNEIDRRPAPGCGPARGWSVAARVMTPDGPCDLGTGRESEDAVAGVREAAAGRERRLVKIDGAFARGQPALAEVLRLVWLTPRMDGLFREGPGPRRRFLDRLVTGFDAGHTGRLAAYEQALRQRARLLRTGAGDASWLAALEDTMARHGVAIAAARRALVSDLSRACALGVGPFPRAGVGVEGEIDAWLDDRPALRAEDELRARLASSRRQDADSGGAAVGPHRSDLAVADLETGQAARQGSTGEQKALLVSIVLAHARLVARERGTPPVLLLDEVAAHLDRARRSALFEELLALGIQAWLTGTEAALFGELDRAAQHYRVENAEITPSR